MKNKIVTLSLKFVFVLLVTITLNTGMLTEDTFASCGALYQDFDFFVTSHQEFYNESGPVIGIYRGIVGTSEYIGEKELIGDDGEAWSVSLYKHQFSISEKWAGPHHVDENIFLVDSFPEGLNYFGAGRAFEVIDGEELIVIVSLIPSSSNEYAGLSYPSSADNCYVDVLTSVVRDLDAIESNHLDNPFPDAANSIFRSYILNLYFDGIENGYEVPRDDWYEFENYPREYRADQSITRAEFIKMIGRAFDVDTSDYAYDIEGEGENTRDNPFNDVINVNIFLNDDGSMNSGENVGAYAVEFEALGIINGYSDGNFHGNRVLTRAHAAKILVNTLEHFDLIEEDSNYTNTFPDVDEDNPFVEYISILNTVESNDEKIMRGYSDGTFRPNDEISRGQAAKIVDLARSIGR